MCSPAISPLGRWFCHGLGMAMRGSISAGGLSVLPAGIEYLTGHGFLTARQLATGRRRATSGNTSPHQTRCKPREFQAQLAAHGIDLVLVPAPARHPCIPSTLPIALRMTRRNAQPLLQDFPARTGGKGHRVFDPTDRLAAFARKHSASSYLATDTTGTRGDGERRRSPANELRPLLPTAPAAAIFRRETAVVTHLGDLGRRLDCHDSRWPAPERWRSIQCDQRAAAPRM